MQTRMKCPSVGSHTGPAKPLSLKCSRRVNIHQTRNTSSRIRAEDSGSGLTSNSSLLGPSLNVTGGPSLGPKAQTPTSSKQISNIDDVVLESGVSSLTLIDLNLIVMTALIGGKTWCYSTNHPLPCTSGWRGLQ
jgi:hypothetical protein